MRNSNSFKSMHQVYQYVDFVFATFFKSKVRLRAPENVPWCNHKRKQRMIHDTYSKNNNFFQISWGQFVLKQCVAYTQPQ